MSTNPKLALPLTRKQQIAAEIQRQRNAEVVHVNEPNPVLMQVAMDEITAANLRTLEAEWRAQEEKVQIPNNSPAGAADHAESLSSLIE